MRLIDADKVYPWYLEMFSAEIIGKEREIKPDEVRFSMNDIRENLSNIPTEQEPKTDKALNLLAEWAVECDFGYDNIPEQYEKYKDNIADMGYAEGLAYIAKMESEG